jgi:anti-sigma factor RsiW
MTAPSERPTALRAPDPVGVLAGFGRLLATEESRLDPVSDEEIYAYVDGTADEGSRLLIEERLAREPSLAATVADLAALRAALESEVRRGTGRTVLPFRRPEIRRRLGWAAAAAAAALLAVVLLAPPRAGHGPASGTPAAAAVARPGAQPLFVDGFEGGSSASWSVVSAGS